jgi:hypothetical protein
MCCVLTKPVRRARRMVTLAGRICRTSSSRVKLMETAVALEVLCWCRNALERVLRLLENPLIYPFRISYVLSCADPTCFSTQATAGCHIRGEMTGVLGNYKSSRGSCMTNQRGIETATIDCTPINSDFLGPCRFPSYAPACSSVHSQKNTPSTPDSRRPQEEANFAPFYPC